MCVRGAHMEGNTGFVPGCWACAAECGVCQKKPKKEPEDGFGPVQGKHKSETKCFVVGSILHPGLIRPNLTWLLFYLIFLCLVESELNTYMCSLLLLIRVRKVIRSRVLFLESVCMSLALRVLLSCLGLVELEMDSSPS